MEEFTFAADGQQRLELYFDQIGEVLGRAGRRASYSVYAMGLLGDGERKSMEPISSRQSPQTERVNAEHQRIQHFITDGNWSDRSVRRASAAYGVSALVEREPISHWIIDDTGFLKKGKHSVGVKRQYTGSAGKVTSCQIGVSLSVATQTAHLPIDFELYLPREWTDDVARRKEARIPDSVVFKTKLELGMDMIDRALADGIPSGMVLADVAYGGSSPFRRQLRQRGLLYGVAVSAATKVWKLDALERRYGKHSVAVSDYAQTLAEQGEFTRVTWRQGTNETLSARFVAKRALPMCDDKRRRAEKEIVWLLMEWENGENKPNKYHFITAPSDVSITWLVRQIKQRWRTERAYEDMKGQLGLDHFEGRRYRGWHHHVSAVLSCYAFIVAEHARHFPPPHRIENHDGSYSLAA